MSMFKRSDTGRKSPKGGKFTPSPVPPMTYTEEVPAATYVKRSKREKGQRKNGWSV